MIFKSILKPFINQNSNKFIIKEKHEGDRAIGEPFSRPTILYNTLKTSWIL